MILPKCIIICILLCFLVIMYTKENIFPNKFRNPKNIPYYINYEIGEYCKNVYKNFKYPYNIRKDSNIPINYSNKYEQNNYLKKRGIPILKNYLWNNVISTKNNLDNIDKIGIKPPFVIKPTNGSYGRDIKMNCSVNDLKVFKDKNNIMIEEQVYGKKYRIYIINNDIIAIHECICPVVIGDGKSDINKLIYNYNNNVENNFKIHNIDKKSIIEQLDGNPIVPKDKIITITSVCNLQNGAKLINIPIENIHNDNFDLFINVSNILGYSPMGIDFISPDISESYKKNNGIILEVNYNPGQIGLSNYNKDDICRYFS